MYHSEDKFKPSTSQSYNGFIALGSHGSAELTLLLGQHLSSTPCSITQKEVDGDFFAIKLVSKVTSKR